MHSKSGATGASRNEGREKKMSKLELVFVKSTIDAYGQEQYAVLERGTGYVCRGELHNRQQAYEIADRIDANMIYERDNGAGSLDFV